MMRPSEDSGCCPPTGPKPRAVVDTNILIRALIKPQCFEDLCFVPPRDFLALLSGQQLGF